MGRNMTNTPLHPNFQLHFPINWELKDFVYTTQVLGLGSVEVRKVVAPERGGVAFSINGYRVSTFVSSNLDDAKRNVTSDLQRWLYIAQFRRNDGT